MHIYNGIKKRIIVAAVILLSTDAVFGQAFYQPEDTAIFNRWMRYAASVGDDVARLAAFFTDTPYAGGTLEGDSTERLRVNLREMDCFTFVENVVALCLTRRDAHPSFARFCEILQGLRYRHGAPDGYLSRLHYTSEWLCANRERGVLWLPQPASGEPFRPEVSFMSAHCDRYPALKANPALCAAAREMEQSVNRYALEYVPRENVGAEREIRHGDLIAITTRIAGLDVSHVGFAVRRGETIHLLHASSEEKKVVTSGESLHDYLAARRNHSGIIVARIR
ncbi:MAG: DUF1460 domain-containing protein [Bacteroidales bacterium]|jgi:hypothetical protein|nr:DUF1460 domain-containing protein [Bacteroidales bacterium]